MIEEIPDCCHSTHLFPQVTSEANKMESEMTMVQHYLMIKLGGGGELWTTSVMTLIIPGRQLYP
jgi:hypothetical protein